MVILLRKQERLSKMDEVNKVKPEVENMLREYAYKIMSVNLQSSSIFILTDKIQGECSKANTLLKEIRKHIPGENIDHVFSKFLN